MRQKDRCTSSAWRVGWIRGHVCNPTRFWSLKPVRALADSHADGVIGLVWCLLESRKCRSLMVPSPSALYVWHEYLCVERERYGSLCSTLPQEPPNPQAHHPSHSYTPRKLQYNFDLMGFRARLCSLLVGFWPRPGCGG